MNPLKKLSRWLPGPWLIHILAGVAVGLTISLGLFHAGLLERYPMSLPWIAGMCLGGFLAYVHCTLIGSMVMNLYGGDVAHIVKDARKPDNEPPELIQIRPGVEPMAGDRVPDCPGCGGLMGPVPKLSCVVCGEEYDFSDERLGGQLFRPGRPGRLLRDKDGKVIRRERRGGNGP